MNSSVGLKGTGTAAESLPSYFHLLQSTRWVPDSPAFDRTIMDGRVYFVTQLVFPLAPRS